MGDRKSKGNGGKPELLAPAGNLEKLRIALHYGADAVYMGLSRFSLRAMTGNFDPDSLTEAVSLVRAAGKRIFVTVNIFPTNDDLPWLEEHIRFLGTLGVDGIIVSDPGIFDLVRTETPALPIHVSTQANITNYRAARFWERMGARRLVLARETTLDDIRKIREKVAVELECFVHGALCIAYSGRCYLSAFLANRSANAGRCTNSCRWRYRLMEETRPGEIFPVFEDDRGTYILSSRDLRLLEYLDLLKEAGVDSFKIEGRMKGINYLGGIVKTYREAIDALERGDFRVEEKWSRELAGLSNRGYTTGMLFGPQPREGYNHDDEFRTKTDHELLGVVTAVDGGRAEIALRQMLTPEDTIFFLSPGLEDYRQQAGRMENMNGAEIILARNGETVRLLAPRGVRAGDLVRRVIEDKPDSIR